MGSFKKTRKISIHKIAVSAIFLFLLSFNSFSQELPANGTVVGGDAQAQLDYSTPNELNVNVHADKVITNWESFNVGSGKTVNFNRDSSFVALNRVTGVNPSEIFGTINAPNGQIFLVNPNGVLFGSGSHVNAAGLVASTLDITNENFMKGNYEFFKVAGKNGYVINKGLITTSKPGGYICLFSQAVDNQGFAIANLGTVALAAGEELTMSLDDKGIISVVVSKEVQSKIYDADGKPMDSAIKNSGTIQADGGKVILTAEVLNDVFDYAINNSGVIQAAALDEKDGVIELKASGAPIVNTATGTIEASGSVSIIADSDIVNDGGIDVSDPVIVGPVIIIDAGDNGTITNTGSITANGTALSVNGGKIALIAATVLQHGVVIANSYEGGTAGNVEIAAQDSVIFGNNSTTAAACPFNIGNGGQIVVTSTNGSVTVLDTATIDVSAGANKGNAGSLEIDAFDQLGFYGVLNGRAPPEYNSAKVTLRTTRPYDSALASIYALVLSGRISAQDISLSSNQGININGTIQSSGTLTIDAQGPVQSLGILRAKTLVEKGASFSIGGVFAVGNANFENKDGAAHFTANTVVHGNITDGGVDGGSIFVDDGVVLILDGNTIFTAANDFVLDGDIYSLSTGIYNLDINAGDAIILSGDIFTRGDINLSSVGNLTQTGTIISGGNVDISGANVTLNSIYFGGTSLSAIATGPLTVNGTIKSAVITFDTGTVTVVTSTPTSVTTTIYGNLAWPVVTFDLTSVPDSATIANATFYYYWWLFGWHQASENRTTDVRNSLVSNVLTATYLGINPPQVPWLIISYTILTDISTNYAVVNGASGLVLGSGNISLNGTNIALNGNLATSGDVNLAATSGAITDGNGSAINITANRLIATAATGIGSGDALETAVSSLSAQTTNGNIEIENTGSLNLIDPGIWGYAVKIFGAGNVNISSVDANLYVNDDVVTSSGDVNLSCGDLYQQAADIVTNGGDVTITTDIDNGGWGPITMLPGSSIVTSGGDIRLEVLNHAATAADLNPIQLGLLDTGSGTVTVIAPNGSISDNNAAALNIIAATLNLSAQNGIGSGNAIETSANNITLNNKNGNIDVDNTTTNGLPVNATANTTNGNINFSQNGNSYLRFGGSNDNGNIYVDVTGGDLYVDVITATGTSALVDLRATGAIFDGNDTTGPPPVANLNITATSLVLSAANGIGSGNALETQVTNLTATNSTSGNIEIDNTGDLNILGVANSALSQAVLIRAHSNLIIGATGFVTTNGGDITLQADGNIYVHNISTNGTFTGSSIPTAGTVTIIAGGNIEDGADESATPIDTKYDISAKKIILNAAGGIGTTGLAPIELRSSELEITAGGDVNLYHKGTLHLNGFSGNPAGSRFTFINSGDLYIENTISTYGDINITVVDDPDLYVWAPIYSHGGNVTLSAIRNIFHNWNGDVYTAGGKFTAHADNEVIPNKDGFYDLAFGAEIVTDGGEIIITADDINLDGEIDAGGGIVTIAPSSDQTIALASSSGQFKISNDELSNIYNASLIVIGSSTAGNITVSNLEQAGVNFKLISAGSVLEQGSDFGTDILVGQLILEVAGDVGTIANAIETETDSVEGTVNGLIHILEAGDLNLNTLTATTAILEAYRPGFLGIKGRIIGNSVGGPNLIATTAILNAADSIDLDTQVTNLSAQVNQLDATGNIHIDNTGALSLNDPSTFDASLAWGYSVKNFGSGNIDISTASPITVNADVVGNKNITLRAFGVADGDITINANITSLQSGTINIRAARDIIHNSGIVSTAGTVNETATRDIEMYDSSKISGSIVNVIARNLRMYNTSNISGTDTNIDLSNNLRMYNKSSITGSDIDIEADNNVILQNLSKISATNFVDINALYLEMSNSSLIEAVNYVTINSGSDVVMNDSSKITSNGNVNITAANNILMYGSSLIHAEANADINAAYLGMHDSAIIEAVNTADIYTSGDVEMFDSSIIQAHNLVKIVSDSDLLMHGSSAIQTDLGSVNIKTAGNVEMYDSSDIWTLIDVIIDAEGEVTVSNSSIHAGHDVFIDAVNNIYLGVIDAGNSVHLTTTNGSIIDTNLDSINLTTPNLYMDAFYNIGVGGDRIDTDVNNVWAIARNGDVLINELNGVNLWDIRALGSTIDIVTGGDTYAYYMLAQGNLVPAQVLLTVNNGILYVNGSILAQQLSDGLAYISLNIGNGIEVLSGSLISATVANDGTATVEMTGYDGDINITDSTISASVVGDGSATVDIESANNLTIDPSIISASVLNGAATVNLSASGDIDLDNSIVSSNVTNSGTAQVNVTADNNITIENVSQVLAAVGSGTADINFDAGNNILIDNSLVQAISNDGLADIYFEADNNIRLITGIVKALSSNSASQISFYAANNIRLSDDSQVQATADNGNSNIEFEADNNIILENSLVKAVSNDGSFARIYFNAGNNIELSDSDVIANRNFVSSSSGLARVLFEAGNNIIVEDNSEVRANAYDASAWITFEAENNIRLTSSLVRAYSNNAPAANGGAFVNLKTNNANITLNDSEVRATAEDSAIALVLLNSANNILIENGSLVLARSVYDGIAVSLLRASSNITVNDSDVKALVEGDGTAAVGMIADNNIVIENSSKVLADATSGTAQIAIDAGNNIVLTDSLARATNDDGSSTVDLSADNNIRLENSTVRALSNNDDASISLYAVNNVNILATSILEAIVTGNGDALIDVTAENVDANIRRSAVNAQVTGNGSALVDISADNGNVDITNSTITAQVDGATAINSARVYVYGNDNVTIDPTTILAQVVDGTATIDIDSDGYLDIEDSTLSAVVTGTGTAMVDLYSYYDTTIDNGTLEATVAKDGAANVYIYSQSDISISDSDITARVTGDILNATPNSAYINIYSDGLASLNYDISITDSDILAEITSDDGDATIGITSDMGSVNITNTAKDTNFVKAYVYGNGNALVDINANGGDANIHNGTITAQVDGAGLSTAEVNIYASDNVYIDPTTITAQVVNGSATIDIDADNGTLDIINSVLRAKVTGAGKARIDTYSYDYTAIVDDSLLESTVALDGNAYVYVTSDADIDVTTSNIIARVTGDALLPNINNAYVSFYSQGLLGNYGDITVTDSNILAEITSDDGNATVDLTADYGSVNVTNTTVATNYIKALVGGTGTARVNLYGNDGNVHINKGTITAEVALDGTATVDIDASDNVNIIDSDVTSKVDGITSYNYSYLYIYADGAILIDSSDILAQVVDGYTYLDIEGDGNVTIQDGSTITSKATGSDSSNESDIYIYSNNNNILINSSSVLAELVEGYAYMDIWANGTITVIDSTITGKVTGPANYNYAEIYIYNSNGDILINSGSTILGEVVQGYSYIDIDAASGLSINGSTVKANVTGALGGSDYAEVDANANGGVLDIINSFIYSTLTGTGDSYIYLVGSNGINIDPSTIEVKVTGSGDATINMVAAAGDINIDDSTVNSQVTGTGTAIIDMDANSGDINLTNDTITAQVDGSGLNTSTINLTANSDVTIDTNTTILAQVVNGAATVDVDATTGVIDIQDSTVKSLATGIGAGNSANIYLTAGTSTTLLNSTILANIIGDGNALIDIDANGGNLSMTDSAVEANVSGLGTSNSAVVDLDATGNIILTKNLSLGTIKALLTGGNTAQILMTAGLGIDINSGTVLAQITGDGSALIDMDASAGDITITNGTITAQVDGSGTNSAEVDISASNNVTIDPTTILAQVVNGTATIDVAATNGNVSIDNSTLLSQVSGTGAAKINITASTFDISIINDSLIKAITASTTAPFTAIDMYAGRNILINNSEVFSDIGKIDLEAANNIDVLNDALINSTSGNIQLTASNNITVNTAEIISNTGDISLSAKNDISIGYLETNGDVTLTADSDTSGLGAVINNGSTVTNVIANDLIIYAATGIGSSSALITNVDNLQATNTTSGDINITNNNPVNGLTIFGTGVRNDGGNITIIEYSPITINAAITALGNINLTAYDTTPGANDGNILINANVVSTNGNILMLADHDIIQSTPKIEAKDNITLTADADNNNNGNFTQNSGYIRNTDTVTPGDININGYDVLVRSIDSKHDVNINAKNDIIIAVPVGGSGSGTYQEVVLPYNSYSWVGGIAILGGDDNYTYYSLPFSFTFYGVAYNGVWVSTNGFIMFANYGTPWWNLPGQISISPTSADWVDTVYALNTLDSVIFTWAGYHWPGWGSGAFQLVLYQNGNIQFNYGAGDNQGQIGISSGDGLNYIISSLSGTNMYNANSIFYQGSISGINAVGTVNLTADSDNSGAGAIIDTNDSSTKDITANTANLFAATGIGSTNALETQISNLTAHNTTSGDINIINDGDLNATSVINDAADGDVTLTVNSNLTIGIITALNSVNLNANTGSILDGNGAANNITCADLNLYAADDIGTSTDYIDTTTGTLTITGADNAYINEFNSIVLNNINVTNFFGLITKNLGTVTSAAGTKITATDLDINADGAIDINTNVDTVNLVTSNDNINVDEDNGLALNLVDAGTGDVTITLAAGAITDNNGAGTNNITANNLSLTAPAGIDVDTNVDTINALTNDSDIIVREADGLALNLIDAGTADVVLTLAAGAITDNNGAANNVVADDLNVNAPAGMDFDTSINTLTAASNGDIIIREADGITLTNVTTTGGDIDISTTAGDIYIVLVDADGNVYISSGNSIFGVGTGIPIAHVTSGGDTTLKAANIIGRRNVLGFLDNVVMVDVAGTLYLAIAGRDGLDTGTVGSMAVSGNLGGTVAGYAFIPGTKSSFNPFVGNPPGYIFFNDIEIWPNYINTPSGILEELMRRGLGYYELLALIRITSVDGSTPFFFGYHPLTPTDYTAFDGINLDIGAYDFIEGNLNLKDKNKLYPYYEENEELKKKNQPAI